MKTRVIAVAIAMTIVAGVARADTPPSGAAAGVPDLSACPPDVLRTLAGNLYRKVAGLEAKIKETQQQKDALNLRVQELERDLALVQAERDEAKKELSTWRPDNKFAAADKTLEVTTTQLETLGEQYVGKTVVLTGCSFMGADNTWVDELPGVTIRSNGLASVINRDNLEQWIGFSFDDSNGKLFQHAFALKSDKGEMLAQLKDYTKINVRGVVVKLNQAGWYGLVCDTIEIVPPKEATIHTKLPAARTIDASSIRGNPSLRQ